VRRFVLDLTDCQLMDSTFLGVLAGIGLRFSEATDPGPHATIQLLNPSERVSGLLENLGVSQLFQVATGQPHSRGDIEAVPQPTCNPDHAELQRTSLAAHELLIQLDPRNGARFKDVCKFLEEDLKKMEPKAPAV
jgi:hypothetical protein